MAGILAVSCNKEAARNTVAVTGVEISQEYLDLEIGGQAALTATVTPNDASNKKIRFSSSKESIAKVSQDGVVEGISAGKAIVTVTTDDGSFKAHCEINVVEKAVHVTGISLDNESLSLKEGESATLTATITPENASNKSINWASSNEEVAIVSAQGEVTALKEGKAIISATTVDQKMTATCAVDVKTASPVTTGESSNVKENSAVISVVPSEELDAGNPENIFGIEYTTTDFKKDYYIAEVDGWRVDGSGYCKLQDLASDQTYYYRAYVISKGERSVGDINTFKTLAINASITTQDATDIKYVEATVKAYASFRPVASYSAQGCVYYSSEYSTAEDLIQKGEKHSTESMRFSSSSYFSGFLKNLQSGTKYYYVAAAEILDKTFIGEVNTFTTKTRPAGSVDLGLKVLWATCNVGASSPEQYGRYFAWGDVVGQTWNGSSWSRGGFTTAPAHEVDSKWDNLLPEYDAAHVILGGEWRMPTAQEISEFIEYTTRTRTTNYNGTGVAGDIFTSKKPGFTDQSIFLPAAGYGDGTGAPVDRGKYTYYWGGTLSSSTYASGLGPSGYNSGKFYIGRTIRAVVK